MNRIISLFLLSFCLSLQTSCSLFFGNVRPIEEKAKNYSVKDLSEKNSDWKKLPEPQPEESFPDYSFRNENTQSVVSLNSACKTSERQIRTRTLEELSHELLLGVSDVSEKETREIKVDHVPALQTSLRGKLEGKNVQLKTVVFQKERCVYDVLLVTKPKFSRQDEPVFDSFVTSFRFN